jgi:Ca-activated chloride channel homolog
MLLLALASAAARADTWSDLWATHEQQAQKLLDSKRPAEAAPLFADPRRRAYAELQAGQYAKAAEHLAAFKDAESQYNRGNALAHTGKLQDALAAYDAALKQSPGSNDVMRNRELVAQALKQQQSGGQSQANGGQSGEGSNGQGGQAHLGSQGNPSQADGNAKSGSQAQPGNQGQQADRGQQGNPSQADNRPQPNSDGQSGSHSQQGNPSQAGSPGQPDNPAQSGNQAQAANQAGPQRQPGNPSPADGQSQAGNRAQQANPSAAQGNATADDPGNAMARSQPPQANGGGSARAQPQGSTPTPAQAQASARDPVNTPAQSQSIAEAGQRGDSRADAISAKKALAGADAPPQQPRSEQALALDQWLRGIPEDSGELLRRKFMIEHMMKQQGNEP